MSLTIPNTAPSQHATYTKTSCLDCCKKAKPKKEAKATKYTPSPSVVRSAFPPTQGHHQRELTAFELDYTKLRVAERSADPKGEEKKK
jgi:hypothetical protein